MGDRQPGARSGYFIFCARPSNGNRRPGIPTHGSVSSSTPGIAAPVSPSGATRSRSRATSAFFQYRLGRDLDATGDREGAIAAYSKAIEFEPKDNIARFELGNIFVAQGKYLAVHDLFRKSLDLALENPWRPLAIRRVLALEIVLAAGDKLPEVLSLKSQSGTAAECRALNDFCIDYLKEFGLAAALCARAFEVDPKLGDDLVTHDRYDAACSALHAANGEGRRPVPPAERSKFRQQALVWQQSDVAAYEKLLDAKPSAKDREAAHAHIKYWLADADVNMVRNEKNLALLPASERREWEQLWSAVRQLRDRTAPVRK